MKYNFPYLQSNISYLKNIYWYRYQYTLASQNKTKKIDLIYKSKNFLVVNKPFDLIVYDFSKNKNLSLLDLLKEKYPFYYDPAVKGGYRLIHRLDYVSSGCYFVPLTQKAALNAKNAFLKSNVKKYYVSLVYGHVKVNNKENIFEINMPIGDDAKNMGHIIITKYDENYNKNENCINNQNAKTLVNILEYGSYNGKPCTKLLLQPITGKRHQLRIHLKYIKHPVIGDLVYGVNDCNSYRTMLHSYRYKLDLKNEHIDACAPDPFITSNDKNWISQTVINKLDDMCF